MKIVAVSQRVDVIPGRNERRDAIDQQLINFLIKAGYLPIPVPNSLLEQNSPKSEVLEMWITHVKPQAVVLSGGNDIGECLDRDWTESRLLDFAQQCGLPALGICRGMQLMAVRAGATLITVKDHVGRRHTIGGKIHGEVNSFHNLAVADCPPGFAVSAQAEDGVIEAIESLTLPWQGWMWHPERELDFQNTDIKRAQDLLGA